MSGLYIHIPFCKRKCNYCDFISFTDKADCFIASYCDALKKEMSFYSQKLQSYSFDTVFIGGGTPSVIDEKFISDILFSLKQSFNITTNAEITIEANPGTLSEEKLLSYRKTGINRLSLGVQSMDDKVLKAIGRIHNAVEAIKSFNLARKCGFDNINIDLMYALPMQTEESLLDTLNKVITLAPEHISAYSLILEERTKLFDMYEQGKIVLPNDDKAYSLHRKCIEYLTQNGYSRYEISNYAKSGRECKHNLNYWQNGEYLGLGIAAHSAIRISENLERWSNTSSFDDYIQNPQAEETHDIILHDEEIFEFVMLSLRKTEGFSLSSFKERFNESFMERYSDKLKKLIDKGWIIVSDNWLRLTDGGLDMQNEVLTELL